MGCNESRKENKIALNDVVLDKLHRLFDKLRTRYREYKINIYSFLLELLQPTIFVKRVLNIYVMVIQLLVQNSISSCLNIQLHKKLILRTSFQL